MKRTTLYSLIMIMSIACFSACNADFQNDAKEVKPVSATPTSLNGTARVMTSRGQYDVQVKSDSFFAPTPCSGTAYINIYSDMSTVITGKLRCKVDLIGIINVMDMEMDLGQMLSRSTKLKEEDMTEYPKSDYFTRQQNPVDGESGPHFTPPRPYVLGPVFQKISKYDGFSYKENSKVEIIDSTAGTKITDNGRFSINVISTDAGNPASGSFDAKGKVIHWKISAEGFSKVPLKGQLQLFDEWEWWFSSNPIAIAKMVMTAKYTDLQAGMGGALDAFTTGMRLTIEFNMNKFTPMKD